MKTLITLFAMFFLAMTLNAQVLSTDNNNEAISIIENNQESIIADSSTVDNYHGAINFNLLGTTPLIGVSLDVYFFQHIQFGIGVGILSAGIHLDYFFYHLSKSKHNLSIGGESFIIAMAGSASGYNMGYQYTNGHLVFLTHIGVYRVDSLRPSGPEISPWGGLSIGYRF